ncbi:isochorismate pyruvate lyase [Pseudomonas sp. BIGb0408]|uniref:chorismate mutase n=1 Tax=Phytopseudomonas flavescens TaxID=29435 RepID=A0A7Z0BPR3_9GAMM|nr:MULTISPECIES: isochorismate lyase [Pseudomonas]MCW2293062.1 isochorismate pyruvate lyase [Pseudomonas sp. BIGb0408]NYH72368.1 isochorismate pyruvate lyase [Pseudomonas flavescens]
MSQLKTPDACESLNDIRAGIDFFDQQILQALKQRLGYVKAAIEFKANEQAIPAPERVVTMLEDRRQWAAAAEFDVAFAEKLFEQIIHWNIQQQILHWRETHSTPTGLTSSR